MFCVKRSGYVYGYSKVWSSASIALLVAGAEEAVS